MTWKLLFDRYGDFSIWSSSISDATSNLQAIPWRHINQSTKRTKFHLYDTVKPLYNDTTYLADRIVIPKASLYLVFVCKLHPKLKLGNDIIFMPGSRNWAIGYLKYVVIDCCLVF